MGACDRELEKIQMKASEVIESVIITVASTATIELAAKSWARLTSIQLRPDTLLICGLMTAFVAAHWIRAQRKDRSMKLRLDLLFRMCYQGPFLQQIRQDAEEKALYGASILRKLKDLAELVRSDPDDHLCSYYIGCLAFLANEKRANLPWKTFRDEVAKHFSEEIMHGKIGRHVIDDHYKGRWDDLIEAAKLASAGKKRTLVFSKVRKSLSKAN
jgi:hypothetical protein